MHSNLWWLNELIKLFFSYYSVVHLPKGKKQMNCFFSFFGEEDWPWANTCCQFSFCLREIFPELTSVLIVLYFVCGLLPRHGFLMTGVGLYPEFKPANPGPPKWSVLNSTTMPQGWPLNCFLCIKYSVKYCIKTRTMFPLIFFLPWVCNNLHV